MFRTLLLPLLTLLTVASAHSRAGWISIKNDTPMPVVIQEVPDAAGKRGKVVRLFPGETHREFHQVAGEKKIQVFDARKPTVPLCTAAIKWPTGDEMFRVHADPTGVRVAPIIPPTKIEAATFVTPVGKP